jgi:hypothetical protein
MIELQFVLLLKILNYVIYQAAVVWMMMMMMKSLKWIVLRHWPKAVLLS